MDVYVSKMLPWEEAQFSFTVVPVYQITENKQDLKLHEVSALINVQGYV